MDNANTRNCFVGLDVHKDQIAVAIVDGSEGVVREFRVGGQSRGKRKLLRELGKLSLQGSVSCAYEAGPTGYGLHRDLTAAGICCQVVAPSLIPRKPGDRIKTDRRDAKKLAILLRGDQLTAVCPPTPEQEAVRDLCRCRSDARDDLMRSRHRLDKMLLRRGRVYREGSRWTRKHRRWLLGLEWSAEADRHSFGSYLRAMESCEDRMQDLDAALETASRIEPYQEPVAWLRCFRGFDTVNAMTVVTELHGVERFDSPRQLMAYLGVVPSENSTGSRVRRGGITKTGNRHARRAIINAARHYRSRPYVGRALSQRREGQPHEVVALADRAQHRLHRRYQRLAFHRELNRNKAVTAVARELTGFIWAALRAGPAKESGR